MMMMTEAVPSPPESQQAAEGIWEPVQCLRNISELQTGDMIKVTAPYGYTLRGNVFDFTSSSCTRQGGVLLKKSEEWYGVVNKTSNLGSVGIVEGLITNGDDTVQCRLSSMSFSMGVLRLYRWETN